MRFTTHQRLSARDDGKRWEPIQIAAPAIVGGVLLLAIAAYAIWKRRSPRSHAYDYHQVRTDWVTKIERMFNPRMQRRVVPSSAPTTLADSMRNHRLDSTDSRTPLTLPDYQSDFLPIPKLRDSPPPMAKRPAVRWWWFFGSRPQEIKSEEPGSRWHVDGPDGSSTGHGHTNHQHEEYRARYIGYDPVEDGGIGATPTRPARALPDDSFVARTPVPTVVVLPPSNESATQLHRQAPSGNRGLPPSYDVSHTHTLVHYPSVESSRQARSEPNMVFPPALRTAGYSSPRTLHGRKLSPDINLPAQSPTPVATSVY